MEQDNDAGKGAVEQDRPEQETNVAPLRDQLGHRDQDVLTKMNESDFPQAGQHEEYSGEPQGKNELEQDTKAGEKCLPKGSRRDLDGNAEGELQNMDPGQEQKRNQGGKKDDDLAA